MARNILIYPRFKFFQNLVFWQAIWFLYFQNQLSAAEAIALYAVYDVATTVLEVPSGFMSDRLGRKKTLCAAAVAASLGAALLAFGSGLAVFVMAQICIGAGAAFASGTDSAMLYESLAAEGRADETEAQETLAWRANLAALALSAAIGGVMAQGSFTLPFICTVVASGVTLAITLQFREPPKARRAQKPGLADHWAMLRNALRNPVLAWLFVLSVLMYGFSHVPFVFGQPFIAEVLGQHGWQAEAPMVSGFVTAAMMGVSVLATLVAIRLRQAIGLAAILLLAFGIQIGLIAVLAMAGSTLAILVLFLRMVPNSWARPFMTARVQPLLNDAGRATYLSLQSFAGRLLFAASLVVAAGSTQSTGALALEPLQVTLGWYALAGVASFAVLVITLRSVRLDGPFQ